jgi:hypothetical protein
MRTNPPNLIDPESIKINKRESHRKPPSPFKKVVNKCSERDEDERKGCTITVFELPRSHFDHVEQEENASLAVASVNSSQLLSSLANRIDQVEALGSHPATLPSEIEAMFEKMAGTMIVMTSAGDAETTLFLDSSEFSQSPFYGTRITIKEFSTAPKAFNIEIASNALALQRINAHKPALLTAFAKGDFNFSIGRLDTEIQVEDRPFFHRKEAASQDEEDQKQ